MALETATFINGLVSTNPTSSDNVGEGDNHLRLIKSTLLATFPAVTGAMTKSHTQLNSAVDLVEAATSANTASAIVRRDASGNFSAGTITASLTGNVTGNASTASAWASARTLTLAGALSGSVSIDGSNNVTLSASVGNDSHSHSIPYVSGLQAALDGKLGVSANAASASRLATARTLALSGDASGSVSFDGSANATITVAVADDSHNHIIGNVDGLQAALDAKQNATTAITTSNIGSQSVNFATSAGSASSATSAAYWTTARTLSLAGDLSGSVSVRGDGNMTLTASVIDDSHTHDGRYYTESEANSLFLGASGTAVNSSKWGGYNVSTAASGTDANTIYFRT